MRTNPHFPQTVAAVLLAMAGAGNLLLAHDSPLSSRVPNTTLRLPLAPPDQSPTFPATLADTGAFADLATLTPQPGLVPFEINVPLWSDGAHKKRWFCLPVTNLTFGFSREGNWSFPVGTVWMKHFELELTNGVPASARRLETRFLVRTPEGAYGVNYRWGDSRTNAMLVPAGGADEDFVVYDPNGGAPRAQRWHYPGRAECVFCHNPAAGYALGFNTAQLNRNLEAEQTGDSIVAAPKCSTSKPTVLATSAPSENQFGEFDAQAASRLDSDSAIELQKNRNQLQQLSAADYFGAPLTNLHTLRALAPATNSAVSLEYRVRSYLAANCSFCHRPDPGAPCGFTYWNGLLSNSLPATRLVNGPLLNNFGDSSNRVISPGDPAHSVMLARVSRFDNPAFHMPPVATRVVNTQAVALLTAWITEDLPRYRTFAEWQTNRFGSNASPASGPSADPDGDGAGNYLEYLTGTDPWDATDPLSLSLRRSKSGVQLCFPRAANRGYEVQWTEDLSAGTTWQPLDVPDNAPFFAAQGGVALVNDRTRGAARRFYRVRVFEP